jgi:hypothetical protein
VNRGLSCAFAVDGEELLYVHLTITSDMCSHACVPIDLLVIQVTPRRPCAPVTT